MHVMASVLQHRFRKLKVSGIQELVGAGLFWPIHGVSLI
jgi:hypothetical protein